MNRLLISAGTLLAISAASLPAYATTMPTADVRAGRHHFSFGLAPSAAVDFAITDRFSLGGSVGLSYLLRQGRFDFPTADIRGVYQFIKSPLAVSGIFGVTGDTRYPFLGQNWGAELGIGLAYPFTPQITGRLNAVAGAGRGLFVAPASGIEVAFKVLPALELALAFNGYGDILGLRFAF